LAKTRKRRKKKKKQTKLRKKVGQFQKGVLQKKGGRKGTNHKRGF